MATNLPDLVARLRIDTSSLRTLAAEVKARTAAASTAAQTSLRGLPNQLGKIGQDSGRRFGAGFSTFGDAAGAEATRGLREITQRFRTEAQTIRGLAAAVGRDVGASVGGGNARSPVFDGIKGGARAAEGAATSLRSKLLALAGVGLGDLAVQAVALGSALTPVLGIIAAIPGAAAAAAAGIGTLLTGLFGVANALKLSLKASNAGGGGSGANAAKQAATAQEQIRSATRGVTSAQRELANAVKDVAKAQRQVLDAQQGVAKAQRDVQSALKGVANANRDVEDAVKGVEAAQRGVTDALRNADAAARQVAASQRGVAAAEQAATKAAKAVADAHNNVLSATQKVTDAQKAAKGAEEALTAARESAQRALAAYQNQLLGAAASEEDADIARIEAQQRLNDLLDSQTATALDIRKARNDVREAELRYQQAVQDSTSLQDEANKAQRAGVEGSDQVVNAKQALADANAQVIQANQDLIDSNQAVVDAQQSYADAQQGIVDANQAVSDAQYALVQANQAVVDSQDAVVAATFRLQDAQDGVKAAEQGVIDARQGVIKANQDLIDSQDGVVEANQRVRDAQENLIDAQLRLRDAQNSAATSSGAGAAAASAAAAAMAKLSPNARAAVEAILGLKDEWLKLQQAVQQPLFDGIAAKINQVANASLPTLTTGMAAVAVGINLIAKNAADAIASPFFQGNMATVFQTAATIATQFAGATGPLTQGLGALAAAAGPVILRFTSFATEGLRAFGVFASSPEGVAKLTDVMNKAGDAISQVFTALVNVGKGIFIIFEQLNGAGFLQNLVDLSGQFVLIAPAIGQFFASLQPIFAALHTVISAVLGPALAALTPIFVALTPLITLLANVVGSVLGNAIRVATPFLTILAQTLSQIGTSILSALEPALNALVTGFGAILTALSPLLPVIAGFIGQLASALAPVLLQVANAFVLALLPVLPRIVTAITQVFNALQPLIPVLADAAGQIGVALAQAMVTGADMFAQFLEALVPLLPALVDLTVQLLPPLVQLFTALLPVLLSTSNFVTQLLIALLPLLPPLVELGTILVPVLTKVLVAFANLINGTVTPSVQKNQEQFRAISEFIRNVVAPAFQTVVDTIKRVMGDVAQFIGDRVSDIRRVFDGLVSFVRTDIPNAFNTAKDKAVEAARKLAEGVSQHIGSAVGAVQAIPGKFTSALAGIGETLKGKGRELIQGLIDGAGQLLSQLGRFFLDRVPDFIKGPFKAALGIRSPSTVFAGYGRNIGEGLIDGVTAMQSHVASAIGELATVPSVTIPNIALGKFNLNSLTAAASAAGGSATPVVYENHLHVEAAPFTIAQVAEEGNRILVNMERSARLR